jgi:hypothetical protein
VHFIHSVYLAREHQQALLAEAAQDQLVQEALRSRHPASSRPRTSRISNAFHRASTALGLASLTGTRAA